MSWEEHDDNCPGCKPAMRDLQTGVVLSDSTMEMQTVLALWKKTTLEERQAWHRVCCNNSRDEKDLCFAVHFAARIKEALEVLSWTRKTHVNN